MLFPAWFVFKENVDRRIATGFALIAGGGALLSWEGAEPHTHEHTHEPLIHAHPHYSDLHHRHRH